MHIKYVVILKEGIMKGKVRYMYPGANTPLGFYSFYEHLLPQRNAKKIFCIKGGPGTGKSTFIKGIGEFFVNKNENVDLFRCSADPESFDGVLLKNRSVLILDGTSPHIVDPHNPAAVDKIIDFGIFWNENKIKKHRDEIINCNEKISRLYGVAYGYLKCLLHEYELNGYMIMVSRIFGGIKLGQGGVSRAFRNAGRGVIKAYLENQ
jgi:hypothetical protein